MLMLLPCCCAVRVYPFMPLFVVLLFVAVGAKKNLHIKEDERTSLLSPSSAIFCRTNTLSRDRGEKMHAKCPVRNTP